MLPINGHFVFQNILAAHPVNPTNEQVNQTIQLFMEIISTDTSDTTGAILKNNRCLEARTVVNTNFGDGSMEQLMPIFKACLNFRGDISDLMESCEIVPRSYIAGEIEFQSKTPEQLVSDIAKGTIDIHLQMGETKHTALFVAVASERPDLVNLILMMGVDPNQRLSDGSTALHIAASNGFDNTLEILLDYGAAIDIPDSHSFNALHRAAVSNQNRCAEILIKRGANINMTLKDGNTPLMIAAMEGNSALVEVLLQHGADSKATLENGCTALMAAAQYGKTECVKVMLKYNVDPQQKATNDVTALHIASQFGYSDIVRLLLHAGAEVNAETTDGVTAIDYAQSKGFLACVNILRSFGATEVENPNNIDPNSQEFVGTTVLMATFREGENLETTKLILDMGGYPNQRDFVGRTSLMRAAEKGFVGTVRMMLEYGADPMLKDICGKTAQQLAEIAGHEDCSKILQEEMKRITLLLE